MYIQTWSFLMYLILLIIYIIINIKIILIVIVCSRCHRNGHSIISTTRTKPLLIKNSNDHNMNNIGCLTVLFGLLVRRVSISHWRSFAPSDCRIDCCCGHRRSTMLGQWVLILSTNSDQQSTHFLAVSALTVRSRLNEEVVKLPRYRFSASYYPSMYLDI